MGETMTESTGSPEHQGESALRAVSKRELFFGFLKIGLLGFGGIAPWARHVIVEERQWVTDKEFAAILGVGQILPGATAELVLAEADAAMYAHKRLARAATGT